MKLLFCGFLLGWSLELVIWWLLVEWTSYSVSETTPVCLTCGFQLRFFFAADTDDDAIDSINVHRRKMTYQLLNPTQLVWTADFVNLDQASHPVLIRRDVLVSPLSYLLFRQQSCQSGRNSQSGICFLYHYLILFGIFVRCCDMYGMMR